MPLPLRPTAPARLAGASQAGRPAPPALRRAPGTAAAAGGGDGPSPQPPIDGTGGGGGVSESVLARLRAAEEEAAALRAQLASVQQQPTAEAAAAEGSDSLQQPANRIDGGGLFRETPFAPASAETSWLSESQTVDFFTGGGLSETAAAGGGSPEPNSPDADAIVRRRLLVGGLATAGLAAFALVPTDALRLGRPAAPLFTYLTPLVRAGPLLATAKAQAAEGDWVALATTLAAIQGPPTEVEANLRAAAAHGDVAPAARTAAAALARDALDAVAAIDYDSYFDTVGGSAVRAADGARQKQFADFSSAAAGAAAAKVEAFLALMPAEAVEAARDRVAAQAAGGF